MCSQIKNKGSKKGNKALKIFGRIFLALLVLIFLVLLVIRSPWGQDMIINKVVDYVSGKTHTKIGIDRLFITFSGNAYVEGLYLEDQQGDTLVYSRSLEASIPLFPLIKGDKINIVSLDWSGLVAKIHRTESTEKFNFDFLIDAFATETDTTTKSSAPQLNIGTIRWNDFKIDYLDEVEGMDASLRLGDLLLEMDELDLDRMRFHVARASITNTQISYTQTKSPKADKEDSPPSTMPYIIIDHFEIGDTRANYSSLPDQIDAEFKIGTFVLNLPKTDLAQRSIRLENLKLTNSEIIYKDKKTAEVRPTPTDSTTKERIAFEWPDWDIEADNISMENNRVRFESAATTLSNEGFNPANLDIYKIDLELANIDLNKESAQLSLGRFSFYEKNGLALKNLAFSVTVDQRSFALANLKATTPKSNMNGNIKIGYESINTFLNRPEASQITVGIPSLTLALDELYALQPQLEKNELFHKLAQKELNGKINLDGSLGNLNIENTGLEWGQATALDLNGTISHPLNLDSLRVKLEHLQLSTNKQDMAHFVSQEQSGIALPDSIQLLASIAGSINNMETKANLETSNGTVLLEGHFTNTDQIDFDARLEAKNLELQKILTNAKLGNTAFNIHIAGNGNTINTLNATLDSDITALEWDGYDFSNLKLTGDIKNGKGNVLLAFKDHNLDANLQTALVLDSVAPKANITLNVKGADLSALGITPKDIKTQFRLQADFKGTAENFSLDSELSDALVVYDNTPYTVDRLILKANIQEKGTQVAIHNKIIQGSLVSNTDINSLSQALQQQFKGYFLEQDSRDSTRLPITMKMDLAIKQDPLLDDVILEGLREMDSISVHADFDEALHKVTARINAPHINYRESILNGLHLDLNATKDQLDFEMGWAALSSGPVEIEKTTFKGILENKVLLLNFDAYKQDTTLVHLTSRMQMVPDTLMVQIEPEGLILNGKAWEVPTANQIVITQKSMDFKDFVLERNQQKMTLTSTRSNSSQPQLGIGFENFRLATFTSFLNPNESLANGILEGNLVVEDPFGDTGIIAKLNIDNLSVLQSTLGNLSLNANSAMGKTYDFDLSLSGGDADLNIKGDYIAAESGAKLDLDVLINEIKVRAVQAFAPESISEPTGSIAGEFKINGTLADPMYKGSFHFKNAGFKVNTLNTKFTLAQEDIDMDNNGIYFDHFTITDANNHFFQIDGKVQTEDLLNPSFDLVIKAKDFQALDASKEDNALFYGNLKLDADLQLKGNLSIPKVTGNLKIVEGSKLTFVVPESQLEVMEREGVVLFVNREDPNSIITKNDDDGAATAIFKGYDINTIITVDDNSIFTIVIDERSGDNFQVKGKGDFNLGIDPNGLTSLSGRYELSDGHYEASLYNLVKRRFDIAPGSSLTWSGDPFNAQLDVRAIYKVETSAAPLMAAQTSAASAGTVNKYRQKIPFLVYLNVEGVLLLPEISFNLDIPEDEQGILGGEVYGRVQQLNDREEELNKQVFSLLVLNRFFPGSTSDGSSGGAASIARDNVNKVLSGQLNQFSDKLVGNTGIDLDFGLDSFTDYQGDAPQERTQLDISASKSLFNNRLIVQVGSEVDIEGSDQGAGGTPMIGNVSLEYLLTENGRFRLKGFRKNEFESVIDGQLIVTGIALIFNREFNQFKELFAKTVQEEADKEINNEVETEQK